MSGVIRSVKKEQEWEIQWVNEALVEKKNIDKLLDV